MPNIVDRWNSAYFDNALSPKVLAALAGLVTAEPDAQALADRVFRLMRMARFEPADLSLLTAWAIGFSARRTVPSAWGDTVPPVTMAGRHHKVDEYVAGNPWHQPHDEPVLVDLGCGFPPFTTVESAARLPDWQVIGVDPEPASTRARFRGLLHRLLPLLHGEGSGELHEVEHGGARLVRNPIRGYETPTVSLRQGEIGSLGIDGGVDVIRCMNVFMYFDRSFREGALEWATSLLRPGGLVLCGSNWARSASSRYTVYQEHHGRLTPREFAFSIENVRPLELSPWYALHDDDVENLSNAAAVATVRADEQFRRRFDNRLDALLAQRNFCPRGQDGYLGGPDRNMSVDELAEQTEELATQLERAGLVDEAVSVLRHAGHDAWRNVAGHVAMRPIEPPRLPASTIL